MYFEAFSRNVNEVIDVAAALAKKYGCRYIGSEHILFGLLKVSDGRASAILREAGVDVDRYLICFKKTIQRDLIISGNMFTPRTKRLFEVAAEFSLKSHSGFVGTEHLLLAVLVDLESVAVTILKYLRVNVEKMTEELVQSIMGKFEDEYEEEEQLEEEDFSSTFRGQPSHNFDNSYTQKKSNSNDDLG